MARKEFLGTDGKLQFVKTDRSVAATFTAPTTVTANTLVPLQLHTTATVDPANILANVTGDTAVTLTGAAVGDFVSVAPPANLDAGISFCAFVASANTLTLRLANNTAGAINVASGTWGFCLTKA